MPDFDTRQPQEPDEPNGLRSRSLTNGLRNLVTAHGLRTLLISGGILLFVVVAVSMLAGRSYYGSVNRSPSPSVETKEPDRGAPTQPCEGIDPDGIRNGKIAFDLADEAVPVAQDPKGMGIAAPDIWTVNPNGSDPVNLTTNSRDWDFDETPPWSPDGRRLAFAKRNTNDLPASGGRICVMGPDGSNEVEFSLPEGESVYEPSWSPDGRRIAFWSPTACYIFLANADGSGTPRKLPTPGFSGCAARPEWSPDGRQIAFQGAGEDTWTDIYVINVFPQGDTSGLRRLTDFRLIDADPAWSPDGTQIAFSSNRAHHNRLHQSEIYKIDVASLKVTRLTHSPLMDTQPTWSPDGEHIAYVKQKLFRGTHSSIYEMDSDGSNSTPVFEKERKYAENPDWAP
jgi:Tol biopolymer transport system component